jgi:hypothetical protein
MEWMHIGIRYMSKLLDRGPGGSLRSTTIEVREGRSAADHRIVP